MGSSIYWCRVDAESFKKYLKADDKFDKLEQQLYEKYQATFDADMDRFNREMEEAEEGKRSFKSVKDELPIYKVVSPAEFDKWFALMRKVNSLKATSCIDRLPHLYTGSSRSKVFAQWILNRRRRNLVKCKDGRRWELRPKNEEWRIILTTADINDLIKRLESVCGKNPVDVHKAFPIYKDIIFGDSRKKFLYKQECEDIPRFAPRFLEMLKFTIKHILGDVAGPGYRHNPLVMDIYP
ncbi:MAG: hypothetical protein IKT27_04580 [Clostridia bacterium]|nr:hypothetical protein [Clostridia bacterium]